MTVRLLFAASDPLPTDIESLCSSRDINLTWVRSRAEAEEHLRSNAFDAVIVSLSAETGLESELLQVAGTSVPIIIHSPELSVTEAVAFTKAGAFSCVSGPSIATPQVLQLLRSAAEYRFSKQLIGAAGQVGMPSWRQTLVGESRPMQKVVEIIKLIAARKSTVLITGETGTGKEVVARAIHAESNRAHLQMVAVNCGAIPATLIEAELFGHTKGAFTGATSSRIGRFEQAQNSTLFLDEIAELPLDLQAKLLRVLQEKEMQRLGSSETIRVDVRIIAAANVNLERAVAERRFREDLYYRLNVVPIRMPAIRERSSDVPLLANHFLERICRAEGLPLKTFSSDALERLRAYAWPGNVRQLEHTIEMAVAMTGSRDVLHASDFDLPSVRATASTPVVEIPEEGLDFDEVVSSLEKTLLVKALSRTNGNKGRAAELLRLKRTTFLAKLKNYHFEHSSSGDVRSHSEPMQDQYATASV